jgi:hypothetical protein
MKGSRSVSKARMVAFRLTAGRDTATVTTARAARQWIRGRRNVKVQVIQRRRAA